MDKKEQIYEMSKIICKACEMGLGVGDCATGSDYHTCGVCCDVAEELYNMSYRKTNAVLEENQKLKHCCSVFERALNNALGIDHAYTDAYKEAEEELRKEEN